MMAKLAGVNSAAGKDDDEVAQNSPFGALKGLFDNKN